jgi:hypothetical protein
MSNVMLDSGAFSSWSKGIEINIDSYISFIEENGEFLNYYVCLDVIGDAEKSYANQKYMEKKGLKPIPVFHTTFEDPIWLQKYIDEGNDYIGLGGMAGGTVQKKEIMNVLDNLFSYYICDKNGIPKVKIHGFGLTSLELMLRYPWYSVDSSSWALTGAFGSIIIPLLKNGVVNYLDTPFKIKISDRAPQSTEEAIHFKTLSPTEQEVIVNFITSKGFKLGKSSYKDVDKKYKLQENERWVTPNKEVEVREELGVSNDHNMRDKWNIQYFVELEQHFKPWPWAFKPKKLEGFGL